MLDQFQWPGRIRSSWTIKTSEVYSQFIQLAVQRNSSPQSHNPNQFSSYHSCTLNMSEIQRLFQETKGAIFKIWSDFLKFQTFLTVSRNSVDIMSKMPMQCAAEMLTEVPMLTSQLLPVPPPDTTLYLIHDKNKLTKCQEIKYVTPLQFRFLSFTDLRRA